MINGGALLNPVQWYQREEGADKTRWTQQDPFCSTVSTLLIFPWIIWTFHIGGLCGFLGRAPFMCKQRGIPGTCKKSKHAKSQQELAASEEDT